MLLRAPQSFHTHTHTHSQILAYSCTFCAASLLPFMLILLSFFWGCCLRVCVGLSISLAPLWARMCLCVWVLLLVWVLTLTFVLCGLSFTLHTPQWHQSPRTFYHLFSQVSVFIVWILCGALQWLLNGRSCLVSPPPPIQFILFPWILPPLFNTLCFCVFPSLCYSDFIAAYFTANKISTP